MNQIGRLKSELRTHGWKGVLRRGGWRLVLAVFLAYLVRDVVLYVVLPAVVYLGLRG